MCMPLMMADTSVGVAQQTVNKSLIARADISTFVDDQHDLYKQQISLLKPSIILKS